MSEALILLDTQSLKASLTAEADRLKAQAIERCALVPSVVRNADENQEAVNAQTELARILKLAEEARKAAKDPILTLGRDVDDKVKAFVAELKSEQLRIAQAVGDFQQLEQKRREAEQRAENERLAQVERDRAAELAKATSHEELDAVNEKFDNRVAQEARPVAAPVRAEGQRITNDYEIIVSDVHALYRSHPNCVKLEPLVGEIKALVKNGITPKGVIAKPITKATVRIVRQAPALNV